MIDKAIILAANKLGLEGKKIIDYIPPKDATDNTLGTFVIISMAEDAKISFSIE